jgi:hypothetical protein
VCTTGAPGDVSVLCSCLSLRKRESLAVASMKSRGRRQVSEHMQLFLLV